MNKKSLLLALITGTAPLIAQDKPSQVLDALLQPLPSVAANIQARATAYPALRQVPSGACAFVSIANVQDNIAKLLNSKLIMSASEGKSAKGIANIPPIESIAIAFDQNAEANITALLNIGGNLSDQFFNLIILSAWGTESKEEYKASLTLLQNTLKDAIAKSSMEGVNYSDINLPEMRSIITMKAGSEALVAELKKKFEKEITKQGLPIPAFKHEGYTIISLPIALGVAMIPKLPAGSMDAVIKSQHYLALKFEGNCISVIYSRDLTKLHVESIEQSMLNSDKLELSDARLEQGIIACSFVSSELLNTVLNYYPYTAYSKLIQTVFGTLADKHAEQAPIFKAAALATAQANKQIADLRQSITRQIKIGNYTNVIWSGSQLNCMAVLDYQGAWNFKPAKLKAWDRVDLAETISYFSISPISSTSIHFDYSAFTDNIKTLVDAASLTLNEKSNKELLSMSAGLEENREKVQTAFKAINDIYEGLEGSITLYADNKVKPGEQKKGSIYQEARYSLFSAVSNSEKLFEGIDALHKLYDGEYKLDDKENDEFMHIYNSASLYKSLECSLRQTPASKEFEGFVFYFNGQAVLPLAKGKDAKEFLQVVPKLYSVGYPKDGKLIFRALLK